MTRKRRRLYLLGSGLLALATACGLMLAAFSENLVFFYSPSDLLAAPAPPRAIRLGGLVEENSVRKLDDGRTTAFRVTDLAESLPVVYSGILPDLFREGQGVVTQGRLGADGVFVAEEVLAKHDERYMPPEVAEALKKSGEWRPDGGASAKEGRP